MSSALTTAAATGGVTAAASLLTLIVSQWFSRRSAKDERDARAAEATAGRAFQARESRYADRRDAIVTMIAAAEDETTRIIEFESDQPGLAPADLHDDYMFPALNKAYAKLSVLADATVANRAKSLRDAVFDCFQGSNGCWPRYNTALDQFQVAARVMLASDAGISEDL